MGYLRNLLAFAIFSLIITGCGGGNSAITASDATGAGSGGTTGGGSSSGSLTLKWSAPTTRADNTSASLSDISGYRLYYGSSATDTPNYVNINDGTATQFTITLPSGSYYFRISAIDTNGYEGLRSAPTQKTL